MKDIQKTNNNVLLVTTKISKHASALEVELQKLGTTYSRFNSDAADIKSWPQLDFSADHIESVVFLDAENNMVNLSEFSAIWWDELYPCEDIFENTLYPKWSYLETIKAFEWMFGSSSAEYINSPSAIISSSNKILQLQKANKLGMIIPETIISSDYRKIIKFVEENVIYKPISRPTEESIGSDKIVLTTSLNLNDVTKESVSCKLSLFQKYINKKYEVRVYVIGDTVVSVEIHSQDSERANIDWRN